MIRGGWLIAALAAACMTPAAWGQASFGPIQPFAGAPTPVYVAAPYAAPTALAPVPGAPVFSTTPGEIQIPAVTAPPPLLTAPATPGVAPPPIGAPGGCGAPSYRLPLLPSPTTHQAASPVLPPGAVLLGTGAFGQPTAYVSGQPVRNYVRYWSP